MSKKRPRALVILPKDGSLTRQARAKGKEPRARGEGQRAKSKEQRAKGKEQRKILNIEFRISKGSRKTSKNAAFLRQSIANITVSGLVS